MTSDSLDVLRRVRDRIERTIPLYPTFRSGFAFGVQTGFKGPEARPEDIPDDPGDPCGFNITWDDIGHWVGQPWAIHREVKSQFCDLTKGPLRDRPRDSNTIEAVYASEAGGAASEAFLDEIRALDGWIALNWRSIPCFGPHPVQQCGWIGLVCLLYLDDPLRFSYRIDWHTEPDRRTGIYTDPFRSPEAFWEVLGLQSDEPPGVFLMIPKMDARLVTIEVIDRLIRIAEQIGDEPSVAPGFHKVPEAHRREVSLRPPDSSEPEAPAMPIILGQPEDHPEVWGREKRRLTPGQYRVVKALLDAHPDRLNKDVLANRSNTEDPVGMIDRLRRDQDWADALDKPGQPHGGYGICLKRPRKRTTRKG